MNTRALIALILALFAMLPAWSAGKNKIPLEVEWKIYQSENFKIYYYPAIEPRLEELVNMAEAAYADVSDKLQHEIDTLVPLVLYETHEEFQQTNIFPGFVPRAVAGFTEPFQNRVVIPVDQTPEELFLLMKHEFVHVFQFDMLYNNRVSTIIRANAPVWFREGMASYVADDETNLDRMILRDVAVNGGLNSLANFGGLSFIAYRVGNAAFQYMEQEYGIEGIRNFLWQYRKNVTGSVGSAIERAFEIPIEDFDRDFRKYLRRKYIELLPVKEEPDDHAREIRTRDAFTTLSPELSPSGDLFAAIIPYKNDLDLVLISTKDGRIFKNLTKGFSQKYTEINVNAFRGVNDLSWSHDGNEIVFTARDAFVSKIYVVNVLTGNITDTHYFPTIQDAQSPIFSKDGSDIYFVGYQNNQYDIFHFNRKKPTIRNLTNDREHDINPRLSTDGTEMLYSSQRQGFYKIFAMDLNTNEKFQLTSGLGDDLQANYSNDKQSIYFSSDRYDDIFNIYQLNLESGEMFQFTNILTGAFSPQERVLFDHKAGEETKQLLFTAYYQGRYRVYRMLTPDDRAEPYSVSKDNFSNEKELDMSANIQLNMDRILPYKIKSNFSIAGANVGVGVTDDGRFLSNTQIALSDTVGNHEVNISTFSVSTYESYYGSYLNRSNRWMWGGQAYSEQSFFINRFNLQRDERRYKVNRAFLFARYPLSLFSRFDFGAGMTDEDSFRLIPQGASNDFDISPVDFTEPYAFVSFSYDSIRYQSYGPQHGMLFDIDYSKVFDQSDTAAMDLRIYRQLTRRSLIAFRTLANYSDGDVPELFTLGGNNNLRGDYEFYEFIGSKRLLTQLELRFPLIDRIIGPAIDFGNIRGAFFADVGGTWNEDDLFNFEFQESAPDESLENNPIYFNPDSPDPNYLLGTIGFEISMRMFGLDMHWTWSKRTNFEDIPSASRFGFWIGSSF